MEQYKGKGLYSLLLTSAIDEIVKLYPRVRRVQYAAVKLPVHQTEKIQGSIVREMVINLVKCLINFDEKCCIFQILYYGLEVIMLIFIAYFFRNV